MNEFHYALPISVKKLKQSENDKGRKSGSPPPKKPRPTPTSADRIINNNILDSWKIRSNEKWETVFRHKSINGPLLSTGCHPCLKYQCKGWCFKDCANRASHVQLKNEDKKKTDIFIKSLRGE